ncbi:alanyl-tRNA editing protein [uncultured Cohaesibacter sp.]|uniref:alanyl-tRNA editing protein n=1 Tax=uncultured Cohaesibacter sp. TaxID=1002546 RepID=UPI002AAB18F2|nr:alanyl-tRNA editing protein [uncultured Cohaesibacter sp.]
MTKDLFRDDSYLSSCDAKIVDIREDGTIVLDQTVFYPMGGGQPGDAGTLAAADGTKIEIATTLKDKESSYIFHVPAEGQSHSLSVGDAVSCEINWDLRYKYMRFHTALHLMSVAVPYPVTGGQVGEKEARLDFKLPDPDFTKESLTEKLMDLINQDHAVSTRWITDEELDAQPDLVKTMSVQPPRGSGKVRLVAIGDVDLQPCGGSHVKKTSEIGAVVVSKIENKGKQNRRIRIKFAD